jgi:hypothetical protein
MKSSKKSQLFVFDMILSFLIVVISLTLVFNYYFITFDNENVYNLNREILNGITDTSINSLNDKMVRTLFTRNKIQNVENTVAQQIVEFYSEGHLELAENLTESYVKDFIDPKMNFNISIKNDTMTSYYSLFSKINQPQITKDNANLITVNKRTVFTYKGKSKFYGPIIFKVEIWL